MIWSACIRVLHYPPTTQQISSIKCKCIWDNWHEIQSCLLSVFVNVDLIKNSFSQCKWFTRFQLNFFFFGCRRWDPLGNLMQNKQKMILFYVTSRFNRFFETKRKLNTVEIELNKVYFSQCVYNGMKSSSVFFFFFF